METKEIYSEQKDENVWRNEWGGDIFFSHGSTHSRGVCILINPSSRHTVTEIGMEELCQLTYVPIPPAFLCAILCS